MENRSLNSIIVPHGKDADIQQILKSPCFSDNTANIVQKVAQPFLNAHKFTSFLHARVHDDGTSFTLYSDLRVGNFSLGHRAPISAHVPKGMVRDSFWNYCPKEYNPLLQKLKDWTQIGSYINFVKRHDGYFDMFSFTSHLPSEDAVNHFMNARDRMEEFSMHFLDRANDVILKNESNRFVIPTDMRPNFKGLSSGKKADEDSLAFLMSKLSEELSKLNSTFPSKLSNRELQCVKYLFLGHTAKEIASFLNVGTRTVEFYLDNIKSKLFCERKSEIISKIIAYSRGRFGSFG